MAHVLVAALTAWQPPNRAAQPPLNPPALDRRAVLQTCGAAAAACLAPVKGALAISATTMTGKSKPELGIILVEAVKADKGGISGDIVLSGERVGTVAFQSPWKLAEGGYYDVEAKSKDAGDSAFVQVAKLPGGKSVDKLPKTFFTEQVLSVTGRFGAYGAPADIKVSGDGAEGGSRTLEIAFTALSPGMAEVSRRGVLTALQPSGTDDVVMLFASTSAARWKKGGKEEARRVVETFSVTTRPTSLKPVASSDYRFGKTSGPSNMSSRNDGF